MMAIFWMGFFRLLKVIMISSIVWSLGYFLIKHPNITTVAQIFYFLFMVFLGMVVFAVIHEGTKLDTYLGK